MAEQTKVGNRIVACKILNPSRSSDAEAAPGTEWRSRHGSPLVSSWWIAFVVGIFVLRSINQRQELQQATTPAPTEHRYWDGHIWTEWVSTTGRLAIGTEPVPDYD